MRKNYRVPPTAGDVTCPCSISHSHSCEPRHATCICATQKNDAYASHPSIQKKMSDQIISIDLGARSTKAVCMEKDGEALRLVSYTIQDRPDYGKTLSREGLAKHLLAVTEALNAKTKSVILIAGANDSLLCHAEMPAIGISQMRKMVKLNPRLYFQEDLPNHSFDCLILHQNGEVKTDGKQIRKAQTLIVAAKNQFLKNLQAASDSTGLDIERVTASQTGAANCFLMSPEAAQRKSVALVDVGFSHSTISLVVNGEIVLTRVVNIGADKFTAGLAEAMNITYTVAEGLKQIMPDKVRSHLTALIAPLSSELNNSIHFFEQKDDKKISEIYVSGGSARSPLIIEILQTELHLTCKGWDPTSFLKHKFTAAQLTALQQEAPQLTVAIGAALSWFKTHLPAIDLLAEQKEEAEIRSRDPMKRGYALAAALLVLILGWYAVILLRSRKTEGEIVKLTATLQALEPKFADADANEKKSAAIENTLNDLHQLSQTRLLFAPALNALQTTVVDNFQVLRLQISQQISGNKAVPAVKDNGEVVVPAKPSTLMEQTVFTIQAKSSEKPSAADRFMDAMATSPWFKANLRGEEPIRLKESQAPQVDATDPSKISILFTIESYAERKF